MPLEKVQNQMKWDRRRQPRKTPQSFTFLQLEHDEGGRVVDLSEEGLRFESFSPIRTANPVPLWFSFNLRDRIEATGQVVWTDARKEVGGLTFINLSPAARQLIRAHIADLPAEEVPQAARVNGEMSHANGANRETARFGPLPSARGAALAVVPRLGELRFPESPVIPAAEPAASEPVLTEVPDFPDQGPLVPLERFVAATRSQFLRGLLLGIVVTALVGMLVLIYALRSHPSARERGLSAPASPANAGAASDPSTTKSSSAPSAVVDNHPAAASQSHSAKPVSDSSGSAAALPARRDVSDSPRAREDASLSSPALPPAAANGSSESARRKQHASTPDQLWEAVQTGNAKAAIILADLYLRGDSVPANCAQARILLQFAAQKNNPEGIKKSRELEKSGCPTP